MNHRVKRLEADHGTMHKTGAEMTDTEFALRFARAYCAAKPCAGREAAPRCTHGWPMMRNDQAASVVNARSIAQGSA